MAITIDDTLKTCKCVVQGRAFQIETHILKKKYFVLVNFKHAGHLQ
jgi:hypothetical protein